jgi:eukaryotic translation initiation factor 2C
MGDLGSVIGLVDNYNPADILRVLNPTAADRNSRAGHIDKLAPSGRETSVTLPSPSAWRYADTIGKALEPTKGHTIRANHYQINPSKFPGTIFQYAIHIYKVDRSGRQETVDEAGEIDIRVSTALLMTLRDNHPEWNIGRGVGFVYDGRSVAFASGQLPLPMVEDKPSLLEIITVKANDGSDTKVRYAVKITQVETINSSVMATNPNGAPNVLLNALDSSILAFARSNVHLDNPDWFLVGSQVFRSSSTQYQISPYLICLQGYYASLKVCMAGLVLVCDMTTSCFLSGGPIINIMVYITRRRDVNDFLQMCSSGSLPREVENAINSVLKGTKIVARHLGQGKKFKSLGPNASYAFDNNGKRTTVGEYFAELSKTSTKLKALIPQGRLKYPGLPCINTGTPAKPVLFPAELIDVVSGQCRLGKMSGQEQGDYIKYSAIRPNERMEFLSNRENLVNVLRNDPTAKAFGTSEINPNPMSVSSRLLPPAKLLYRGNQILDPKLSGSWNLAERNVKFLSSPGGDAAIPFAILVVSPQKPPGFEEKIDQFIRAIEQDSTTLGCNLRIIRNSAGNSMTLNSGPNATNIKTNLETMKKNGARFAFVMNNGDFYGMTKFVADQLQFTTQMTKWKNIDRQPQGFGFNLMLKVNTKLGGTNHVLVSRATGTPAGVTGGVYQYPPQSICWAFDVPAMLVGMDVSHGEIGSTRESIAAIVASMDNKLSQYSAHISAQTSRQEMINDVVEGMVSLFKSFQKRNGNKMPQHIIVYRDGVADGQFDQVIEKELPLIKQAVALMGYDDDKVKVSIIICQKGHHTRATYPERLNDGSTQNINLCPGVVMDANGGASSIASSVYNEFYLNSHVAIQGTAKCCKYALIYDEIGMKMSEIELLTYWTTYLYCRANKSVSYAAPAYYAHWASKRGAYLSAAGATNDDLKRISALWTSQNNSMFFV